MFINKKDYLPNFRKNTNTFIKNYNIYLVLKIVKHKFYKYL